jgi:hypothetical protein
MLPFYLEICIAANLFTYGKHLGPSNVLERELFCVPDPLLSTEPVPEVI